MSETQEIQPKVPPVVKSGWKYWAGLSLGLIASIGAELYFGDVLIDSTTGNLSLLTKILIILISGGFVILLITRGMTHYLLAQQMRDGSDIQHHMSRSRALSVIPMVRAVLFATIVLLSLLVVLSGVGVDIGPMIAGAGLMGVIIGLGTQSLLKDILAGIFYIIDDAFRIGEYVEIGQLRGTVERISLRSLQIRHHRGALQTIPYGTITSVSNQSRDWVIVKMSIQLPHDTDILKVKRIVKEVSAEIVGEADFKPFIIEPLKFQGIDDVDLYGLNVRLKFMAIPGEQFLMRREMLRRLQIAFEANGIKFARRTVSVEGNKELVAAADDDEEPSSTSQ